MIASASVSLISYLLFSALRYLPFSKSFVLKNFCLPKILQHTKLLKNLQFLFFFEPTKQTTDFILSEDQLARCKKKKKTSDLNR